MTSITRIHKKHGVARPSICELIQISCVRVWKIGRSQPRQWPRVSLKPLEFSLVVGARYVNQMRNPACLWRVSDCPDVDKVVLMGKLLVRVYQLKVEIQGHPWNTVLVISEFALIYVLPCLIAHAFWLITLQSTVIFN